MTHEQAEIIISGLPSLSLSELKRKWAELFGTYCYSQGRDFLIRRITWRLRNELAGGLSERAQARAELICDEALIRLRPQRYKYQYNDPQSLTPQSVIQREYKGQVHEVVVLNKGRYSYENEIYDNLTSVAWKIAGYKISGNKFFNLPAKPRLPKSL